MEEEQVAFKSNKYEKLIKDLEDISLSIPNRILRCKGYIFNNYKKEQVEIIIFKGFSCSTTHPTIFDADESSIKSGTILESAELLIGPMDPGKEIIVKPESDITLYKNIKNWY